MKKLLIAALATLGIASEAETNKPAGVVSHIKVLSDKVEDVSSMEAWRQSFIKPGMTDEQKAVAAWRSSVAFVYQDSPPVEYLHEACVHDAIKTFNVYGYGMCCCASARIEQFARYMGLQARGHGIRGHSVPEVFWDNDWHMLDASLVNYFTRDNGTVAGVADICQAVQGWLKDHPGLAGDDAKLRAFQQAEGWTGWKRGPELLANCRFYDWSGWWPAKTHGWYSTMQEFDGRDNTPFPFEYGYSQGYEVNIQLRPGERLTRNWYHKGLHVNDDNGPGCLNAKVGEGAMKFLRDFNNRTEGRIGSGTLEYDVPRTELAGANGMLEIEMPCSYVYLTGKITLTAGPGVRIQFSDNNGLDWRAVATPGKAGSQTIDLTPLCRLRYNYRLRISLNGSRVEAMKITHDIQCSQRALPALVRGSNTISFSAGPHEGTVTIEGSTQGGKAGKQVTPLDFHPLLKNVEEQYFRLAADGGSVTFPIATPGDMTRLRFGGHYRLRDKRDQWEAQVSFDGGRTFRTVDTQTGPYQGICKYVTVPDVPAGTRNAQVRWVGATRNTACIFLVRVDADYKQPFGGFRPVRITYSWAEDGVDKTDVHVARTPQETYTIACAATPVMKSIALELAQ